MRAKSPPWGGERRGQPPPSRRRRGFGAEPRGGRGKSPPDRTPCRPPEGHAQTLCGFCLISAYRRRMPTPYGSRGGMAFGAQELRVLRRALALALHPTPASAEDVEDCLRLAESVDEAAREGARLRAFPPADLARYRLPCPAPPRAISSSWRRHSGSGYRPDPTTSPRSGRCAATPLPPPSWTAARPSPSRTSHPPRGLLRHHTRGPRVPYPPDGPARRPGRALGLGGTREEARGQPRRRAAAAVPGQGPAPWTVPSRPLGEVFPPKRKPAPPPANPPQQLAAG